jgi:hypothetical protein
MCAAKSDVRFAPVSDRESGFPQKVMSALPPKADMCVALAYVRFGPKAYSFSAAIGIATRSLHRRAPKNSSAARCPCILAVLRLRTIGPACPQAFRQGFAQWPSLTYFFVAAFVFWNHSPMVCRCQRGNRQEGTDQSAVAGSAHD